MSLKEPVMQITPSSPSRFNAAKRLASARRLPVRALVTASLALMLAACGGDSSNHGNAGPFETPADHSASPPSVPAVVEADTGVQAPTDYSALQTSVSASVEAGMGTLGVRGLSIALVDEKRVPWMRGFGMADAEAGIAADADTIYEAGSVSKVFTATAILQLAEQGKLQLDRPIEDAVPDFRIRSRFAQADPITPRRLLTHHAGIPEDMMLGAFSSTPIPLATQVSRLADEYLAYPPGQVLAYSNFGFTVLGRAIEVAAGTAFPDYMQSQLLTPLGMNGSAFRSTPLVQSRMAKPYGRMAPNDYPPAWLDNGVADGGLRSSARDLSRYVMAMLNGGKLDGASVIRPASLHEAWQPQNAGNPLDLDLRIGLAWFLDEMPTRDGAAVRLVFHGGSLPYHQSYVALLPDHGLGVAVLANTDSAGPLVEEVARETLRQALKAKYGIELAAPPPAAEARPLVVSDAKLAPLAGLYAASFGPAAIEPAGGRLAISSGGEAIAWMEPHEGGRFKLTGQEPDQWFSFKRIGGHDALLRHVGAKRIWSGVRVEPRPLSDAWRSRIGRYALATGSPRELVEQIDVVDVGGFLMLSVTSPLSRGAPLPVLLQPDGEELAIMLGMGRGKNEAVRFGRDERGDYLVFRGVRLERSPQPPGA